MTVAAKPVPLSCPVCSGRVDVKSPHVLVAGTSVRVYCSAECLRARDAKPADPTPIPIAADPPTRRIWWWLAGGIVIGTTCLAIASATGEDEERTLVPPVAAAIPAPHPEAPSRAAAGDAASSFDAAAAQRAADDALVAELAKDAWLHPLAGPKRRMPVNHNGAFGADRAGERPPECVSGHCGVDLGNSWGEPVHAVHAGLIDFVHRGPNHERGGIFVKIAHRDGKLFTWYFHLAAVPRWIRPGVKVTAGQVIGLLGDTGVKHSAPHLHFAISVKPSKAARERYLDPEPLIAIWPLWIPNENRDSGRISTVEEPGLPVRAPARRKPPRRRAEVATPAVDAPPEPATTSAPPVEAARPEPATTSAPPVEAAP